MLTKKEILTIFNHNLISGRIETGQRYWVSQCLSLPYRHKLTDKLKELRELTLNIPNISCYPMEDSLRKLSDRLETIACELYKFQYTFNK